jgi:hypothetical protein
VSEKDITNQVEDLTVEDAEGEAVVGGHVLLDPSSVRSYDYETEYARLKSMGFVEESCTTEGALMVNTQTGARVTLSY